MGNFYTNITLKGANETDVVNLLEEEGNTVFVYPAGDGDIVVFDAMAEMQHPQLLLGVCKRLSGSMSCVSLAVLNHDDDILAYWLCSDGELIDEYNSCPGALGESSEMTPEGGNAAKLCSLFGVQEAAFAVEKILRSPPAPEGEFIFAVERHFALAKAIGLPLCSVGYGYLTISSGELPAGIDEDKLIKIGEESCPVVDFGSFLGT